MYFIYTALLLILYIVCLLLCSRKLVYGVALCIACEILVPYTAQLLGIPFLTLLKCTIILFCLNKLIRNKKALKNVLKYKYPFTYFLFPLAIIGLGGIIDYSFQLKEITSLAKSFLLFYPVIITIETEKDFQIIMKSIVSTFIVIGIYGIITYIINSNPYVMSMAMTFGISDTEYLNALSDTTFRGGLTSRATGTAISSLVWGQSCLILFPMVSFLSNKYVSKTLLWTASIICFLNIFLSGQRSCLLPLIILQAYYLLTYFGIKKSIQGIFLLLVLIIPIMFTIHNVPALNKYEKNIQSTIIFWDDDLSNKNAIGGSNKEMRLEQLKCSIEMTSDNLFWGLGLGYPSWYKMHYGRHSIMLGFESILFVAILSSGLFGVLIWILFFSKNIQIVRKKFIRRDAIVIQGICIMSFLMTGIQSTFQLFLLLIALMIVYPKQFSLRGTYV